MVPETQKLCDITEAPGAQLHERAWNVGDVGRGRVQPRLSLGASSVDRRKTPGEYAGHVQECHSTEA